MSRGKFLLLDQKRNTLLLDAEEASCLLRQYKREEILEDVRQHGTLKELDRTIREYLKEGDYEQR